MIGPSNFGYFGFYFCLTRVIIWTNDLDTNLEDSMIGGEEDDLSAILAEIDGEVEQRPDLNIQQDQPRPEVGTTSQEPGPSSRQQASFGSGQILQASGGVSTRHMETIIEHQVKLMEMMTKQQDKNEESKKRKERDVSYEARGPVLLLEEGYRIEDDGHTKLDLRLRQRLRPINADPKDYWVKGAFERVDGPILGAGLYLEHLMPNFVNQDTICKTYDVQAFTEIKNYLSKNAGVDRESQKKLKVKGIINDSMSMGIQTDWEHASDLWEVMDAGWNYIGVLFMMRNYSYTGLAMMRCLHECRYFCGVAKPKLQRTLIEGFFNECLR